MTENPFKNFLPISLLGFGIVSLNIFKRHLTLSLTQSVSQLLTHWLFFCLPYIIQIIELSLSNENVNMFTSYMYLVCHSLSETVTDETLFTFWLITQEDIFSSENCIQYRIYVLVFGTLYIFTVFRCNVVFLYYRIVIVRYSTNGQAIKRGGRVKAGSLRAINYFYSYKRNLMTIYLEGLG